MLPRIIKPVHLFITLEKNFFGFFSFRFYFFQVRVLEFSHSGYYRDADATFSRHRAKCELSYNKVEWGWGRGNVELYLTVIVTSSSVWNRWNVGLAPGMALNIKKPFLSLADQWCLRSHLELAVLYPPHHHWILLCSQPCPGSAFRVSQTFRSPFVSC